jgi:hypothetical protein
MQNGGRAIAVEVSVDPKTAMVVDVERLKRVGKALNDEHRNGKDEASQLKIENAARSYWSGAISLAEYREQYDHETGMHTNYSFRSTLPPHFGSPEVLVPGSVDPGTAHWVSPILYTERHETSNK